MYRTASDIMNKWLRDVPIGTFTHGHELLADNPKSGLNKQKGLEISKLEVEDKLSLNNSISSYKIGNVRNSNLVTTEAARPLGDNDENTLPSSRGFDLMSKSCLTEQLVDYYEDQVQENLDFKYSCEEIAYAAVHKILRKVQTVDDRFRANSLLTSSVCCSGIGHREPIFIEMMLQLCIGESNCVFMKREKGSPYARIQLMSSTGWEDCTSLSGFISPAKLQHTLRRYVRQAVHVLRKYISQGRREKLPEKLLSLVLEDGPSIIVSVNENIRVRIIPALSVPDNGIVNTRSDTPSISHVICVQKSYTQTDVATKFDNRKIPKADRFDTVWKPSFYIAEKNKIRTLSSACRLQLLRTLVSIRDSTPALHHLAPYHFKTIVLRECDNIPSIDDWEEDYLEARFIGLLRRIKDCLESGECLHYFMRLPEYPQQNLFYDLDKDILEGLADTIQHMIEHPQECLKFDREINIPTGCINRQL